MVKSIAVCLAHVGCASAAVVVAMAIGAGCSEPSPVIKQQATMRLYTNSIGMKLIYLPGGDFMMGDKQYDDAQPVHRVTLSSFWVGQFEVTNTEYEKFKRRSRPPESLTNRQPVTPLTWSDAVKFCEWLSKKERRRYRLPTEGEWEYAARGGLREKDYPWGDEDPQGRATFNQVTTTPVGTYAPNSFGLFDMSGNAWEWVSDWYGQDYYAHSPSANPVGPPESYWVIKPAPKGKWKILRGGFFQIADLSIGRRSPWPLDIQPFGTGFRVVLEEKQSGAQDT